MSLGSFEHWTGCPEALINILPCALIKNALDNKLLFALKLLFFPLTFCNGNIWIVVLLVGIAAGLTMLELPTALNIVATSFATFYGLLLVLMLWGRFIGWLASLADEPDK